MLNKQLLSLGFILFFVPLFSQPPQGIHFQAVARNASGVPYSSQALSVSFLVQDGGGTTVYQETHNVVTDLYGLFEAVVGAGKEQQVQITDQHTRLNQQQKELDELKAELAAIKKMLRHD